MEIETREMQVRDVDTQLREVTGLAVPYDTPTRVGDYTEVIARDAVQTDGKVMLFWRHNDPIGLITDSRHTEAGWEITARFTEGVQQADEAYALVRDGVIDKFSIGFKPVEQTIDRESNTVTRTKITVVETSLVPQPAYEGATVSEVRESVETKEIPKMSEEFATRDDLAEMRETVETLERSLAVIGEPREVTPAIDTRSAGAVLAALVTGDETEARAYTGATTSDTVLRNGWAGDLTRIVEEAAPLRGVFGEAVIPAEGNYVEYATLTSNSIDLDVQAAEGDDLAYGELVIDSHTAPVVTYGGFSELSRQSIERSSIAYLDHVLRAQAMAVGKQINGAIRSQYVAEHAAQITAGNTVALDAVSVAAATYGDWLNAAIDAQVKFQTLGLSIDALIVDPTTFKSLLNVSAADGRPVFLVTGNGSNNVGSLNVTGLKGDLASIPVIVDAGLTDEIAFVNRNAITFYGSAAARLQDENIVNLSKTFSVYMYGATASTLPGAIVPVVLAD